MTNLRWKSVHSHNIILLTFQSIGWLFGLIYAGQPCLGVIYDRCIYRLFLLSGTLGTFTVVVPVQHSIDTQGIKVAYDTKGHLFS